MERSTKQVLCRTLPISVIARGDAAIGAAVGDGRAGGGPDHIGVMDTDFGCTGTGLGVGIIAIGGEPIA